MKLKFDKIYLFFLIAAFVISVILYSILANWITPYQFELKQTLSNFESQSHHYIDLNHDGYSELYKIKNYPKYNRSEIVFFSHNNSVTDQFNFPEKLVYSRSTAFFDVTKDGTDECLIFTVSGDSLFLYIIDIRNKNYFLKQHFIFLRGNPKAFIKLSNIDYADINNDGKKELLFIYGEGPKPKKRGVFVFDLNQKEIIYSFENNSAMGELLFYNLDETGTTETVVSARASGNIYPKDAPYTDWKNWIFILDNNLKIKFPPLSLGKFPSNVSLIPSVRNGKPEVLVIYQSFSDDELDNPNQIYLLTQKGELKEINTPQFGTHLSIIPSPIYQSNNFFASYNSGTLVHFDEEFKILKINETGFNNLKIMEMRDLDLDGVEELIAVSASGLKVFDKEFNLLAGVDKQGIRSFRHSGLDNNTDLGISNKDGFYTYSYKKNQLFEMMPVYFPLFIISIVVLLSGGHRFFLFFNIFLSYLTFSLKKSKRSLIIINPRGKIYFISRKVQDYLDIKELYPKKKNYLNMLDKQYNLTQLIKKSIQNKKPIVADIVLGHTKLKHKASVSVIPFTTKFNYTYAYLVEINDLSDTIYTDRQRIWSRTVQKMAHDIKTPLAAVKLNLETLRLKMTDYSSNILGKTAEDFSSISIELDRIREMTSDFLKFTNLEKPNYQSVSLVKIISKVQNYFQSYTAHHIKIEIKYIDKIDHFMADAQQLELLFRILIENAIDAIAGKGLILIETVLEDNLNILNEKQINIIIADSGPGISQEERLNIFEPYYTTKSSGTGMGLAIAEKIVTDHGGEICLINHNKFGAVFQIVLPLRQS